VTLSDIASVAAITVAAVVIIGAIGGAFAWFYKRGGQERSFDVRQHASDEAIERNTAATEKLSEKLDDFKSVVIDMFHGLDKRVTILEKDKK
jgi:hypothetical protein